MRLRAIAALLAVAAIVTAGVTFSGAAFTAASAAPSNGFTASNAFNLSATMTDPGAYLRATATLGATASDGEDGSSISSVKIQRSPAGAGTWTDVCTDPTSPYSCSFDTTAVGDGLYDFRAIATNNTGGTATSTAVTNRRVDNTAPTAGTTDPGTPLRGTVTVGATGTDGGSGVADVKIQRSPAGAGTWTDICTDSSSPYSCSWNTAGVSDGLYDLRAVATDNAANSTNSAVVTNRRVDNTAPTATMTNPGSPITGNKSFDGTSTDTGGSGVASLTFQVSPIGAGTWSDMCSDTTSPYACSYNTAGLSDGQYDFRSLATDNAGNTATSTVYSGAIVDNGSPTAGITDPGQYLKGTLTVDASGVDGAGSGILNVKIQRSPAGTGTWTDICTDTTSPYQCSWNTGGVGDGLYDLRAVATDNVSLSGTSSTVANRRVDNTAPTATMNDPGAYLSGTSVNLSASATDGGSGILNVKIQRSPAGAGSWTDVCTDTTFPYACAFDSTGVTDGLYDFRAISTDNATNQATSATVTNRRVDNTAPTASLTDPGSPLRLTVTLNATGTDTGGSGVLNVQIQRAPTGTSTWTTICTDSSSPYSCSWNTTLVPDGGYDLRAITTDNANNVAYSSTVSNRVVDNTAPTATDIQTANASGGTVGKADQGDTIVFTFSEQLAPGTIVAGWNGTGTQAVTVTLDNGDFSITGATLISTSVTLPGGGYTSPASKSVVFANSTIALSGNVLTVTLGAPDKPQWLGTGSAGQMGWSVAAGLTDIAGNTLVTPVTTNETGGNDAEF